MFGNFIPTFVVSALLASVMSQEILNSVRPSIEITPGNYNITSIKCEGASLSTCFFAIGEGSRPEILNVGFPRNPGPAGCRHSNVMAGPGVFYTFNNGHYVQAVSSTETLSSPPFEVIGFSHGKVILFRKSNELQLCDLKVAMTLIKSAPRRD